MLIIKMQFISQNWFAICAGIPSLYNCAFNIITDIPTRELSEMTGACLMNK